jgi:hypothetical protein
VRDRGVADVRRAGVARAVQRSRDSRELFFWTARQVLLLVFLTAMTLSSVVSLFQDGDIELVRRVLELLRDWR